LFTGARALLSLAHHQLLGVTQVMNSPFVRSLAAPLPGAFALLAASRAGAAPRVARLAVR